MNHKFPKLAMAKFSDQFKGQNLIAMHNTNPEPFRQNELEDIIGQSFNDILQDVNLGFAPDAGTLALRKTLAQNHYETLTADSIITHAGAQEALFCAFSALLQAQDRVLIVAPVFEPLVQIPLNMGCDVSYVHLHESNNWSLDLAAIEAEFKLGCKLFVINFPHNPTGAMLTENELKNIVKLCKKYAVWLLSDEVFRGLEHSLDYRLPAVADLYAQGISVGVISKAFAIPGIRVGWLACQDKVLRDKVLDVKAYISICNSQIDEKLAAVVLKQTEKLLTRNLKIILNNKKLLASTKIILQHEIEIISPNAGCCVFAQIKAATTAAKLVQQVANDTGYLLYPSAVFKTQVQALRIGFGSAKFTEFVSTISG